MKSKLLIMAGVLAGSMTFATTIGEIAETGKGVALVKQGKVVKLIYKATEENTVTIQIYGPDNKLILSDRLKGMDGFSRPYNFSGMSDGTYTVVVNDGKGTHKETISLRAEKKEKLVNLVKMSGEDKYLFTASGDGEEVLTLNIYDELDNLIHKETKRVAGEFGQVYNLNKIKGGVTFEVVREDGSTERLND